MAGLLDRIRPGARSPPTLGLLRRSATDKGRLLGSVQGPEDESALMPVVELENRQG